MATTIFDDLFAVSSEVRYVALYRDGKLESRERAGLAQASSSESDKYEELIVNPALLKLVQQRGDIDCGGAQWIVIRYGNFYQHVRPVEGGHVSIGMELSARPLDLLRPFEEVLGRHGLLA